MKTIDKILTWSPTYSYRQSHNPFELELERGKKSLSEFLNRYFGDIFTIRISRLSIGERHDYPPHLTKSLDSYKYHNQWFEAQGSWFDINVIGRMSKPHDKKYGYRNLKEKYDSHVFNTLESELNKEKISLEIEEINRFLEDQPLRFKQRIKRKITKRDYLSLRAKEYGETPTGLLELVTIYAAENEVIQPEQSLLYPSSSN